MKKIGLSDVDIFKLEFNQLIKKYGYKLANTYPQNYLVTKDRIAIFLDQIVDKENKK